MKKQLITLLFAITALSLFSCIENGSSKTEVNYEDYIGDFTVSKAGVQTYSGANVNFTLDVNKQNKIITLTMYEMKFDEKMPVTLNITVSNIAYSVGEDGTYLATKENVIPTVANVPMPKYELSNLEIEFNENTLEVGFDCMGFSVDYDGVKM